jgi:HAD superfamily hydrolase (TIGR01509 family)
MENIKFLYFDAGNVIFNRITPDGDNICKLLNIEPLNYEKILQDTIKLQTEADNLEFWNIKTIEDEYKYLDKFHIKMCNMLNIKFTTDFIRKLSNYRIKAEFEIKDGVLETLEKLSSRYKIGMLSNALPSRRYHELKIDNIEKYFNPIIISWEEGVHKPDPEIFEIAIKKSGFNSSEIVLIDDKVENLDAALKAGFGGGILCYKNEHTDKYQEITKFNDLLNYL